MDTNLQTNQNTSTAQVSPSAKSASIEVSAFERELPYLSFYGVPFQVIEKTEGSDMVRIRIEPLDHYSMVAYSIAYSQYGFDKGKAEWLGNKLHPVKPAA